MEQKPKDELLAYFMGQTNERLMQIESKLVELIAFKAEVKSDAKNQAMWVSVIVGIFSIILNVVLKKYGML